MSFLTESILKDRLSHKTHFESIEQHKYARLAMASYYYQEQEYVFNELFNPMLELQDFVIDKQLSTEEHSVFHNAKTKETVISYRGTTNLNDVKTDSHIALGREKHTERYKRSEEVFEKTKDKYGNNITTTGHSLGGGISLHISEKYDVKGHHFNPAISPTQVFNTDHYNNNSNQKIYRTKLDPVSIGGEVISDHQPKREVITVGNSPNHHAHALENFYSNKAKRTSDNSGYEVKKENLQTTIDRHKNIFKRMYDAYEKIQDIDEYLDSINSDASVFTKLPKALPKAIAMAKRGADPQDFTNETAKNLNPFFGFNPSIEYKWNDDDVVTPLRKLGKAMRTDERRRTDHLLSLGETQPHQQYTQQDEHHLLSASGVSYQQVMGQNFTSAPTPQASTRRRITDDYQVVTPEMTMDLELRQTVEAMNNLKVIY